MAYPLLLTALGLLSLALAGRLPGVLGWAVAWFALNLLLLAVAYSFRWHRMFGKRPDGTLAPWGRFLFWPWLTLTTVVWRVWCWSNREPIQGIVAPRLVLGRRLLAAESSSEFDHVLDLTAEFAEPAAIRARVSYRSFAILDGSAPTVERFLEEIERLRSGRTYVHCAQGHGRSALVAVAILLRWGLVRSVEAGLERVQRVRPGARLNRTQLSCLKSFASKLAERRDRELMAKSRFLGDLVSRGKPLAEFTISPVNQEDLRLLCDDLNALGPDFVVEEHRMSDRDDAPQWLWGEATREALERLLAWPVRRCPISKSADFFAWQEPPTPPRWPAEIASRIADFGLTQPGASDEGQADNLSYQLPDGSSAARSSD